MRLTLLEHPLSPYAQKNKIALREKVVDFVLATHETPGALAASLRTQVPTLCHDDLVIFDSKIIQQYIEETWPHPVLAPASPAERARVRMIEEIMDTQYEAIVWGMMEIATFGRAPGDRGKALTARARTQLAGLHDWLTRELGDRQWFNGEAFGWGDIAVAPYVLGAVSYGAGPEPGKLSTWLTRALARLSVARTEQEARAAATASLGMAEAAIESGAYKREYRDHRLEWMIRSGGLDVVREGLAAGNIRFSTEIR